MYRLKRFEEVPVNVIRELDKKCFPSDVRVEIKPTHIAWVIFFERQPVAFALLAPDGFMSRAGVLDEHQGKGLHKRLIRARIKYARVHKYKCVWTYTHTGNAISSNNLIKMGFKTYDAGWKGPFICWVHYL